MALQTKTLTANGSNGYHKFTLNINENSTSVSNNTSSLSFNFVLSPIQTSWNWAEWGTSISYSISIGGNTYTGYIPNYDGYSNVILKSDTLTIQHDSNGTKQINASFNVVDSAKQYYTCGNASSNISMSLTNIPRAAQILSAPDFNDEQNPTITYSNSIGNNASSLQACISLTGAHDDISYRDISKTGSSYTFNLTENERNVLRNSIPNSNERYVIFFIRTVIGGVTYHSTLSKKFAIVNGNPTFSSNNINYADVDTSVVSVTHNNQLIVRNKSNLSITYSAATARKGASITSYSFSLNGVVKNNTAINGSVNFGVINSASDLTLSATVIDSRGNSTTTSKTITCCDYYAPSFKSFNVYRANSDGSPNMNGQWIKWDYSINYASVNNTNSPTVRIYGTPINSGSTTSSGAIIQANDDNTYNVYAVVTDSFGVRSQSYIVTVYGQLRVINISPDGTNVAIGKTVSSYDSNGVFDCRWKIKTGDPVNTLHGLSYRGDNAISSVDKDTSWNWNNQGNLATTFYSRTGQIHGQPSQYGFLLNVCKNPGDAETHQLWMEQNNGSIFHRGGNGDMLATTWKALLDSTNYTNYVSPRPDVLYESSSGTTGTVTLSQDAANYNYIEIFLYKDEASGWWSVKVPSPNGKIVQIGTQYHPNDPNVGLQMIGKAATINGTAITPGTEFYVNLNKYDGTPSYSSTQTTVKIMKVIGYR